MCHSLLNQSVVNHAIDEWRRHLSASVDTEVKNKMSRFLMVHCVVSDGAVTQAKEAGETRGRTYVIQTAMQRLVVNTRGTTSVMSVMRGIILRLMTVFCCSKQLVIVCIELSCLCSMWRIRAVLRGQI